MISASVVSAAFAYMLIPGMGWYEALVIGACLGPTDPVLAGSVIKGHFATRHVDRGLKDVLLAEVSPIVHSRDASPSYSPD